MVNVFVVIEKNEENSDDFQRIVGVYSALEAAKRSCQEERNKQIKWEPGEQWDSPLDIEVVAEGYETQFIISEQTVG